MAQILVRNLDAKVIRRLKERAREAGRSLQAEVKMLLEESANAPKLDMKAARRLAESFRRKFRGRKFPDSIELIREGRDR